MIVGLVDLDAYAGSSHKNPFNFKHFNADYIHLTVDGESLPGDPFNFNFNYINPVSGESQPYLGNYVKAYDAFFEGEEP